MKISNIKKGIMGTINFEAKFNGMRKPQEFVVYPLAKADLADRIKVQSDIRIGWIDLLGGRVLMSPSVAGGAYNPHLALAREIDTLDGEELLLLKANIMGTAHKHAGLKENGFIQTDNSGPVNVLGAVAGDEGNDGDGDGDDAQRPDLDAPGCAP